MSIILQSTVTTSLSSVVFLLRRPALRLWLWVSVTDATGAPEPDPSNPPSSPPVKSSKASILYLLALPLAALLVVFGLWTVTRGDSKKPADKTDKTREVPGSTTPASADPSLVGIAVQQADLPEPSIKCSFSGDMETYLRQLKDAKSEAYASVLQTWTQLQGKGATAAYIAYWGDARPACDSVISPPASMDHGGGTKHPTTTFSFVVRYKSPESADDAYKADIFGQSKLKEAPNYEVTSGAATGLGANSVVGLTPKASIPLHQAVWQNGSVTVYYGSENLPLDKSKQVTDSINRRIT